METHSDNQPKIKLGKSRHVSYMLSFSVFFTYFVLTVLIDVLDIC